MLMRCLVGHSWSPGIEKAPDEGALWVCGIKRENVCARDDEQLSAVSRAALQNKLQYQYITTSSRVKRKLKMLKSHMNCL
jgi:hypothetical protein